MVRKSLRLLTIGLALASIHGGANAAPIPLQSVPGTEAGLLGGNWAGNELLQETVRLLKSGDRVKAKEKLAEFLRTYPNDPRGTELAGMILLGEGKNDVAALSFQRALTAAPNNPALHAKLGVALLLNNKRAEGEKALGKALQLNPGEPLANRYLAWIAETQGDYAAAAKYYEAAIASGNLPANEMTEIHTAAARLYNSMGRPDKTVRLIGSIVERSPRKETVLLGHVLLAHALLELNQPAQAKPLVHELGHLLKPDDPELLFLQGYSLVQSDPPGARAKLEKVLTAAPERFGPAKLLIARSYAMQGDLAKAASTLEELAAKVEPTSLYSVLSALRTVQTMAGKPNDALAVVTRFANQNPSLTELAYLRAEMLLANGANKEAREALKQILTKRPDNLQAAVLLGGLNRVDGRFDDAEKLLKPVVAREPTAVPAWLELAKVYTATSREDLAASTLSTGLNANAGDPQLLFELASLHNAAGRIDTANKLFEELLSRQPGNVPAMIHLGLNLADSGKDMSRARELTGKAYELAKASPEAQDAYGWVLAVAGDRQKSVDLLQKAATARPEEGVIAYHLGAARIKAGKVDQGKQDVRRAISLGLPQTLKAKAETLVQ